MYLFYLKCQYIILFKISLAPTKYIQKLLYLPLYVKLNANSARPTPLSMELEEFQTIVNIKESLITMSTVLQKKIEIV